MPVVSRKRPIKAATIKYNVSTSMEKTIKLRKDFFVNKRRKNIGEQNHSNAQCSTFIAVVLAFEWDFCSMNWYQTGGEINYKTFLA